jgi:hypothetical protein
MKNIIPKNSHAAQFYFYGDIDPVEGRAYFAGPHQSGLFYVISFPVNKKTGRVWQTGRAWQAGRTEVDDFTSKQEAIDFIKTTTGNY